MDLGGRLIIWRSPILRMVTPRPADTGMRYSKPRGMNVLLVQSCSPRGYITRSSGAHGWQTRNSQTTRAELFGIATYFTENADESRGRGSCHHQSLSLLLHPPPLSPRLRSHSHLQEHAEHRVQFTQSTPAASLLCTRH